MKIGIIGTGRIAERFVKTVLEFKDTIQIVCIYNPHAGSADRFLNRLDVNIENCTATDSMDVLLSLADSIYIASPHETHYSYSKMMLENGMNVLCEKPLALCRKDAEELFDIAEKNNLVLMEAIKTAYCPGFELLKQYVEQGIIGEIRDIEAAFTRLTEKDKREYQDLEYGGSFLEFGSYVLMPAVTFYGEEPEKKEFRSVRAENGVDEYTKVYLDFANGFATGKTGIGVKSEGQLLISGTKGYILVPSPWWLTSKFQIRFENPNDIKEVEVEYIGSGLQYEIEAFEKETAVKQGTYIRVGRKESCAMASIFEQFIKK